MFAVRLRLCYRGRESERICSLAEELPRPEGASVGAGCVLGPNPAWSLESEGGKSAAA